MKEDLLPDDLVWGEGGHVSDVVLTAIGDGQDAIVSKEARAHIDGCAACKAHLGHVALLSLYTHERVVLAEDLGMLGAKKKKRDAAPAAASFRFPFGAVMLAFAIAVVTSIPGLVEVPEEARGVTTFVQRNLHILMHHFTTSARASESAASQGALVLTVASTVCLTFLALLLARKKPAREANGS